MEPKDTVSSGNKKGRSSRGGEKKKNNDPEIMDNNFMLLDELVYAPLHALAESNQKLRAHVVDSIRSMGSVKQNGQEEVIHLDNMNIAYDQIRQESEDGYNLDNLQMQVPLLSVVPITNLTVEKAEIAFATEVRAENDADGKVRINGRICSQEQRDSDFLPRVSYHMKIRSIPATEGVMRITDMLSSNQMAKQLDTTPVTINGNLSTQEQKDRWQEISQLKSSVKRLKQLYQKVTENLSEQEKLYQISYDANPEDTYSFHKDTYLKAQSDIMNQIMEIQEKIMELELKNGEY